jgi:hypothetical protein
MARPNELLRLSGVLGAVTVALILLPLSSARVALRGGGALERLGAGEQKISQADAISLGRWRVGLAALSVSSALGGLVYLTVLGILGIDPASGGTLPPQLRAFFVLFGFYFTLVNPVVLSGWWTAMATASCICRDNITETIRKVRAADPASTDGGGGGGSTDPRAWVDSVATPALGLRESMGELSDSLGPRLLGLSGGSLLTALGFFTNAVNVEYCTGLDETAGAPPGTARHVHLAFTAFLTAMALLLAKDPASTSSRCDLLMAELNAAGIRCGPEHHGAIDWLESRLRRLNDGQGLGFRLGHTVVSRKFLTVLGAKLAGSFTTLYAIITSLGDTPAVALAAASLGEDVCELSEVQASMIRAAMLGHNASCVYNMSVASVIEGA